VADLSLTLAGDMLTLLPERAVFQPAKSTIFIADVHLGKVESFRVHAVPLPDQTTSADLSRLSQVLQRTQASRLVILGDLIHSRSGYTDRVIAEFTAWRSIHAEIETVLVAGNHDRFARIPEDWRMCTLMPPVDSPPFLWAHHPALSDEGFTLAGHLHPAYRLSGKGRQQLKLPCFWHQPGMLVLPAFGGFIDSAYITPSADDRVCVVAGDDVLPV